MTWLRNESASKGRLVSLIVLTFLWTVANGSREGLTRMESYRVNTTIESRFAQTSVLVDFVNELDCATLRGWTMQLPLGARVTSLSMSLSNGCTLAGEVKELQDAVQSFNASVSEGKPAALLSAWDSTNYAVQVSLPPNGTTRVEVRFEELLLRRRHQVAFQVPIFPGISVDQLVVDVTVKDPYSGVAEFDFDQVTLGDIEINRGNSTASAHYELFNILEEDALPRLLRGYYNPGPLPEDGLLLSDGTCFEHLFNPTSLLDIGPLDRSLVFVIDISGSMTGQKLTDAKAAFGAMIETLTSNDFFTIHSFSDRGTEDVWGPRLATSDAKVAASTFVNALSAEGSTNLHAAYIDGINRAIATVGEQAVPIVLILTDGQATEGVTYSEEIARDVKAANENGRVKIFALAFGEGADLPLLLGISIQNGGLAVPIYEGYGDAVTQMEDFYVGELGSVLLSDVNVVVDGDVKTETQTSFPVLSDGAEIAVRGKLFSSSDPSSVLRVSTTANTAQGSNTWTTDLVLVPSGSNRECHQSFAHSRITELFRYLEAGVSLGDELEEYATFSTSPNDILLRGAETDFLSRVEAEALDLALEAGLVWPGLTAMVTVESSSCTGGDAENAEVCYDGDGYDAETPEGENFGDSSQPGTGHSTSSAGTLRILFSIACVAVTVWMTI